MPNLHDSEIPILFMIVLMLALRTCGLCGLVFKSCICFALLFSFSFLGLVVLFIAYVDVDHDVYV